MQHWARKLYDPGLQLQVTIWRDHFLFCIFTCLNSEYVMSLSLHNHRVSEDTFFYYTVCIMHTDITDHIHAYYSTAETNAFTWLPVGLRLIAFRAEHLICTINLVNSLPLLDKMLSEPTVSTYVNPHFIPLQKEALVLSFRVTCLTVTWSWKTT